MATLTSKGLGLVTGVILVLSILSTSFGPAQLQASDDDCLSYSTERVKDTCNEYETITETELVCDFRVPPYIGPCLSWSTETTTKRGDCKDWEYSYDRVCTQWAYDNEDDVTDAEEPEDGNNWEPIDEEDEETCDYEVEYVCDEDSRYINNGNIEGYKYTQKRITEEDCSVHYERVTDCVNSNNHAHVCVEGSCVAYQYEVNIQRFLGDIGIIN